MWKGGSGRGHQGFFSRTLHPTKNNSGIRSWFWRSLLLVKRVAMRRRIAAFAEVRGGTAFKKISMCFFHYRGSHKQTGPCPTPAKKFQTTPAWSKWRSTKGVKNFCSLYYYFVGLLSDNRQLGWQLFFAITIILPRSAEKISHDRPLFSWFKPVWSREVPGYGFNCNCTATIWPDFILESEGYFSFFRPNP